MGMIANLLRVSAEELTSYLEDSSLLEQKLDAIYDDEDNETLTDLDKAWEGVLFLFTGESLANLVVSNHPFSQAIIGNDTLDEDQDLGFGPAQYLLPEKVNELNKYILAISDEELAARYNPEAMNELGIYPEAWDDESLEYVLEYVGVLRDTYATAAANNEAIIAFIN